jgi:hypothetical protein
MSAAAPRIARPVNAITLPPAPMALARSHRDDLRIFDAVPDHHAVIAMTGDGSALLRRGEVAVYDTDAHAAVLQDGGLYVVESQTPAHGMPVDMFARMLLDRRAPRMRVDRCVRRLVRSERNPEHWWFRPLKVDGGAIGGIRVFVASDGPYCEIDVYAKVIGRVVGIYNPAAIGGDA